MKKRGSSKGTACAFDRVIIRSLGSSLYKILDPYFLRDSRMHLDSDSEGGEEDMTRAVAVILSVRYCVSDCWLQEDVMVKDDGNFTIEIPLRFGETWGFIYVYPCAHRLYNKASASPTV